MMVWMALLPAIVLMGYIYKKDRVEKEPLSVILRVLVLGALSSVAAMFLEVFFEEILEVVVESDTTFFAVLDTFLGVALIEELCKYYAFKIGAWKSKAFNYRFDAIVYAVAASLGFAALENVLYVMDSGMDTAVLRAFTAVPGHAIDGITMGLFLGPAKAWALNGNKKKSKKYRRLAILIPVIEHGLYDVSLELGTDLMLLFWIVFVIGIDIWAFRTVRKLAREDQML